LSRDRALLMIALLTATACGSNVASDANRTVATSDATSATTDQAVTASDGTLATTDQAVATTDAAVATSDARSGAQDTIAQGAGAPEALRFRAPLVGGGEIDMSTLADKPVVLWFWAPY
jgi:hypothetical protein